MTELDCEDLEALGLWSTSRCCRGCHAGSDHHDDDDDELVFEVVEPRTQRTLRLVLCCASADTMVLDDASLALLAEKKAS